MTHESADTFETDLNERLGRLTLEQKARLVTGDTFWSLWDEPVVGLRRLVVSDGPAGVRGELWDDRDPSANVPSPTSLAATWDEALVERMGALLAVEARRKGVDVLLAPTVNLHRTPFGGRHFEAFSEDPYLTGRIGVAYVKGLQDNGVGGTVKHFVANDSETERFTANAIVDERTLRELYLAPFEPIVGEAHSWAVMAAYNSVNGHTMTESPLMRDVLKDEWDYDGLVMSDWYAARSTDGVGNNALDLAMPGPTGPLGDLLVAAIREGRVSEAALDDKVLRLLRLAARVGALEGYPVTEPASMTDAEISAALRAAAAQGSVLVRNSADAARGTATLPLAAESLTSIALIGPNAVTGRTLGGGSATVFPPYTVSPLAGLQAAFGPDVTVTLSQGVRAHTRIPVLTPDFIELPDGSGPGVQLRFLDAEGNVAGSQVRHSGSFTWLGGFGEDYDGIPAAVEVEYQLVADREGAWTVGASGVGSFTIAIDGETVYDQGHVLAPGADPVEAMMSPPQGSVEVQLAAGGRASVLIRHVIAQADAAFVVAATAFQVNLDTPTPGAEAELAEAVALAAASDVAVVIVGTNEEVESEGYDRTSLALPGEQDALVRAVVAANPRTIVVVNSGAPVLMPWADDVAAVLLVWFPGQEFGAALGDILTGAAEPGGRLPTTWPSEADVESLPSTTPIDGTLVYSEGLHIGYRAYERDGRTPTVPFGYGLGYTTWDLSAAAVTASADGSAVVDVVVTNTGSRTGRQVAQVYLAKPNSVLDRPVVWLAAFASVEAEPGESVSVSIPVAARSFEHWDVDSAAWAREAGDFLVTVGSSVADRAPAQWR